MMEIQKNKRKSKCGLCLLVIDSDYKVIHRFRNYHLRCYYKWLIKKLDDFKKTKKKLDKYKKYILLEALD